MLSNPERGATDSWEGLKLNEIAGFQMLLMLLHHHAQLFLCGLPHGNLPFFQLVEEEQGRHALLRRQHPARLDLPKTDHLSDDARWNARVQGSAGHLPFRVRINY